MATDNGHLLGVDTGDVPGAVRDVSTRPGSRLRGRNAANAQPVAEGVAPSSDDGEQSNGNAERAESGQDAFAIVKRRLSESAQEWGDPQDGSKKRYPNLWRFLCVVSDEKGCSKRPASLSIRSTPSGFACTLSDDELGYRLAVHAQTLAAVFLALERAILDPKADWQPLGRGKGYQKRMAEERKRVEVSKQ